MSKYCFLLILSSLCLLAGSVRAQLYEVTTGEVTYDHRNRPALKVSVEGSVETTRDFWQDYMKEAYSIRFKSGALATLGLKGKRDALAAQQVPGTSIASRPVDLYVNLGALNDSTTEVVFFGGFGDKTYFEPTTTAPEFRALRTMLEKFAPAARVNAYQVQVKEAENNVTTAQKEQDKLIRSLQAAQKSTAANLKRIDELTRENKTNAQQMHQDSTQLTGNAQLREQARLRLQSRRERLAAAGHK